MGSTRIALQSGLSATVFALVCAAVAGTATNVFAQGIAAAPPADYALLLRAPGSSSPALSPKYRYLFTPSARWTSPLVWTYNHAHAPASFAGDKVAVIARLQAALGKWTARCGINAEYAGEWIPVSTVAPGNPPFGPQHDGDSVIGWGVLDRSFNGWTYAWYAEVGNQRTIIEADITLAIDGVDSLDALDQLATHEWGHALGLDHSDTESAVMAGPPSTHYNGLTMPQDDDIRGCRCLYGLPAGASAPYACEIPAWVDLGDAVLGTPSPVRDVTFTNSGNAPLTFESSELQGAQFAQFAHVAGCLPGTVVLPGASCTLQIQVVPTTLGSIGAKLLLFGNDGYYELALHATGVPAGASIVDSAATVDVIEFYNATLDHYFITWNTAEIASLDAGASATPWVRTGLGFRAYATAPAGTSQVCRYYIPPVDGSSHFFGRDADECSASLQAHPEFIIEDSEYMHLYLPSAGVCPTDTVPVYRVFSARADANHRYVTDRTVRDQMMLAGWMAEGDGPDLVVMCAPPN